MRALPLLVLLALSLVACEDERSYAGRRGAGAGDGGAANEASGGDGATATTPSAEATPCEPTGESYGALSIASAKTDRPAAQHGDLNLELRRWERAPDSAARGLVDIDGPTDARAPKLASVLGRGADVVDAYRVQGWDWTRNAATEPMSSPEVTLLGLRAAEGELVRAPRAGYDIGDGLQALVLYASPTTITLKYTRDDDVVRGYTVHLAAICTDAKLLEAYRDADGRGRGELPAVSPEQPVGRARSGEVLVAVRDTGAWMDPRARKDWW